jgi:phosphoribosyl 1,2-cyclic phosphate phosphodiesterase
MRIEILGSGGALTTPRVGCQCPVCVEARAKGVPYSRSGPSTFVHGPDLLIDTPEEIKDQLNRSQVTSIGACIYSHWHPDHTAGRRVWESANADPTHYPPRNRCTDIYLPEQVAQDFRTWLGSWEQYAYMQHLGLVNVIELSDGDTVTLNGTTIRPFRLAEDYVYAFLLEEGGQRVLIAPDELNGWVPPDFVQGVDLAIIPMGLAEFHPLTGERLFTENHPLMQREATYVETLEMVRQLKAGRVIMTHIEETTQMGYDDLLTLEDRLRADGFNITFAYDTMTIEV